MCGLFGAFGTILEDDFIDCAFKTIHHRGPDDSYSISINSDISYTSAAVRLSFQDVQHGRQPFHYINNDCDENIIASLNGEIYNYADLRKDLELKGYNFGTDCDTEIIPALYSEFGEAFVDKLDGMFAISLIDHTKKLAFLYTDFLGQKPLYFACNNNELIFASDLNTLNLISQRIQASEINEKSVVDLLKYKSIINPSTIYKDIFSMGASRQIKFDLENKSMTERSMLNRFTKAIPKTCLISSDHLAIKANIEQLLLKATKSRIDPLLPQSFYLSGGIDSSLIVALARNIYPNLEFNTFNLEYTGEGIEKGKTTDSEYAQRISDLFKTNHKTIYVDPSELDKYLPSITRAYGEPFSSVPSMWFVAREMKKYCKYTLSGDGADELFGSYYTHRSASNLQTSNAITAINISDNYTNTFVDSHIQESSFYKSRVSELNSKFQTKPQSFDH